MHKAVYILYALSIFEVVINFTGAFSSNSHNNKIPRKNVKVSNQRLLNENTNVDEEGENKYKNDSFVDDLSSKYESFESIIKNTQFGESATKLKNSLSKNKRPQLEQLATYAKDTIDNNLLLWNEGFKKEFANPENGNEESKSNDQNEDETSDTSGDGIFGKVFEDISKYHLQINKQYNCTKDELVKKAKDFGKDIQPVVDEKIKTCKGIVESNVKNRFGDFAKKAIDIGKDMQPAVDEKIKTCKGIVESNVKNRFGDFAKKAIDIGKDMQPAVDEKIKTCKGIVESNVKNRFGDFAKKAIDIGKDMQPVVDEKVKTYKGVVKSNVKSRCGELAKKAMDMGKKMNDPKIYELKVTLGEIEIQTKGKFDDLTNNMPDAFDHISKWGWVNSLLDIRIS
ncbi:Plasmodium exported protein, unknown function [Plasmodium vinckei lentum]|uniref:Uncharacterized protein n=1 Tax=Plasmodium vinckei lentum TaxID=138297 RepID=A0A6V7RU31_PLAVN|nr:Plasmodium exported protein, unknown function [Plasmodium vinckei lentum]